MAFISNNVPVYNFFNVQVLINRVEIPNFVAHRNLTFDLFLTLFCRIFQ